MTEPQDPREPALCEAPPARLKDPLRRCLAVAGTAQRRRVIRHGELRTARQGSAHRGPGCTAKGDHGAASSVVSAPAYSSVSLDTRQLSSPRPGGNRGKSEPGQARPGHCLEQGEAGFHSGVVAAGTRYG